MPMLRRRTFCSNVAVESIKSVESTQLINVHWGTVAFFRLSNVKYFMLLRNDMCGCEIAGLIA